MKNLPNQLTLIRILLVPLLLVLYPLTPGQGILSAGLFAFAALTDWLDGYLARRLGAITPLGSLLDPIADKMLIAASLVLLTNAQIVPAALTGILVCRDIAVNGIRLLANEEGFTIQVKETGKWKTALQSLAIFFLLIKEPYLSIPFQEIGFAALCIGAVLSVVSAGEYSRQYLKQSKDKK